MFLAFDTDFVTGWRIFFENQMGRSKLPRIATLNNFVDKIVTAIQKSLKLLLYLRNQPEVGATLSKKNYKPIFLKNTLKPTHVMANPWNTCYTIFQTDVKVTVFR